MMARFRQLLCYAYAMARRALAETRNTKLWQLEAGTYRNLKMDELAQCLLNKFSNIANIIRDI